MRGLLAILLLLVLPGAGVAVEIPVERVKPPRGKHETLRFLRANRDFIREALDGIRAGAPADTGDARPFDPRATELRALLDAVRLGDREVEGTKGSRSLAALEDEMRALAALSARAAALDSLLDRQGARLDRFTALYDDGATTSLRIVLRGAPPDSVSSIALLDEDGGRRVVRIDPAASASELLYERIEPRRQVLEFKAGSGSPRYVTLEPEAGRTHLLELDASTGWTARWTPLEFGDGTNR